MKLSPAALAFALAVAAIATAWLPARAASGAEERADAASRIGAPGVATGIGPVPAAPDGRAACRQTAPPPGAAPTTSHAP
jgi:hypothetical protein